MRQWRGAIGAALATAALVLLAWAAAGPVVVLDPELERGGARREGPVELPSGDQTPMPALDPLAGPGADARVRWDIVADVVGVLLLVLLAAALWRVWRWWRGRRTDRSLPDDEDVDAELLLRATGSQARRRATEGDPRNAIVACWVALEDAAERAGLARDPAETAGEFTARVLATWEVAPATVSNLADLYRTARFSRRPITETDRAAALDLLGRIHQAILIHSREDSTAGEDPMTSDGPAPDADVTAPAAGSGPVDDDRPHHGAAGGSR
ncbi:DUF4129 domain-containing protein [Georgenia deserti]|uniref:DUF4129 domain-containing protein n=1 Tax=Georgenia deserti TaxID=2093781 RepID=A0ABW4L7U3_9MICO